ncbi:MAG: hemerythrin domain-containing protein [Myxococcota bacterium]
MERFDDRPSEIRRRIREEHDGLRELLAGLDEAARQVLDHGDDGSAATLRQLCGALHVALAAHLDLEDAVLAPALRDTDAFGPDRADELLAHHADQRKMLASALAEAKDETVSAEVVARHTRKLIGHLMADMAQEDRDLLNPNLLRDDPTTVDEFTG